MNAVSPGTVRTEMLPDVFGTEEEIERIGTVRPAYGKLGIHQDA